MRTLMAACLAAGCASAGVDTPATPDGPAGTDTGGPPDTPAQMVETTLQQTTNTTVAVGNSAQCAQFDVNNNIILTHENSWFRVYSLAEAGITTPFTVSKVTFAVELATNEPPLTVKLGTYGGTPDDTSPLSIAQASFVQTTTTPVPNTQTAITIDVPLAATIPANSNLIVEIDSTNHTTAGEGFIMGTTSGPFQHTAYLLSGTCGLGTPTAMANVCAGCGASQAIISVTGTH